MYRGLIASILLVTLLAGSSFSQPVGWWKLDETSGTDAADSSATGRTGTLSGDLDGDEWIYVDSEVAGLGGALQFSGSDYVDLGSAAGELNPADGPFAIAAWMKVTNGGNRFNTAFGFGDCCGTAEVRHAIEFGLEATGPQRSIYSIDSRGGGGDEMELLHPMGDSPVDRWVHMVATREDDGTASVYMRSTDGAINTSGTTDKVTGMLDPTNGVSIGRTPFEGGDRYAQALIADVQFYHSALSVAEVTQLFDNPGSSLGSGPVVTPDSFSWRIDSSGDWNLNANWTPSTSPNANSHSATLGAAITSSRTVFTDTDVTVQSVQFENDNSYIIAGGATVTLDGGDGSASVNVLGPSGVHEFQSRVALASDTDVDIATGTTLEFNNRLTLADNTLTKVGGGTLAINNNLSTGGGMVQQFEGKISGGGTIAGDVNVFAGTIAPGDVAAAGNLAAVPEPSAVALIGMGLVLLVLRWGCDSRILLRSGMTCLLLIGVMAGSSSAELVGWWKLDETSGLVAGDSSASVRDGELMGLTGTEWVDVDGEVSGLGGAIQLDGVVSNYIDLGEAAGDLNPGAGTFSVASWMKVTDAGSRFNTAFGFGDCCNHSSDRDAIEFGYEATGLKRTIFSIDARGEGENEMEMLRPFAQTPVDRWVHMVGVRELDGTSSLYVHSFEANGGSGGLELSATDDRVTGLLVPTGENGDPNRINIGRTPFSGGDRAAHAQIADVQFYHQAMTEAEALQLFENPGTSLSSGPVETPDTFSWRKDLSGDWTNGSNWTPFRGPPSTNEHTAVFGDIITAKRTVFTDADVTVKNIQFENANSYVIAGGSTVQLDGGTGTASISVAGSSGTHEFQTRVAILTDTQVNVATGTTLEFNNRLNLGGNTLTKTGGGDLAFNSFLNTGGGVLELSAGSITGEGTIVGDVSLLAGTISPGSGGAVSAVPEPSSLLLAGLSLLLLVVRRVG